MFCVLVFHSYMLIACSVICCGYNKFSPTNTPLAFHVETFHSKVTVFTFSRYSPIFLDKNRRIPIPHLYILSLHFSLSFWFFLLCVTVVEIVPPLNIILISLLHFWKNHMFTLFIVCLFASLFSIRFTPCSSLLHAVLFKTCNG